MIYVAMIVSTHNSQFVFDLSQILRPMDQDQLHSHETIACSYHCQEGNAVPQPCELGQFCPNTDLSGCGPQPCPRLHYRDDFGAEQVFYSATRCYMIGADHTISASITMEYYQTHQTQQIWNQTLKWRVFTLSVDFWQSYIKAYCAEFSKML